MPWPIAPAQIVYPAQDDDPEQGDRRSPGKVAGHRAAPVETGGGQAAADLGAPTGWDRWALGSWLKLGRRMSSPGTLDTESWVIEDQAGGPHTYIAVDGALITADQGGAAPQIDMEMRRILSRSGISPYDSGWEM